MIGTYYHRWRCCHFLGLGQPRTYDPSAGNIILRMYICSKAAIIRFIIGAGLVPYKEDRDPSPDPTESSVAR
jgi:hypothetical protein